MQWWMIGLKQAEGPWLPCSGGLSKLLGLLFGHTFKKLYNSIEQSVLLYGAEACICLRCLEQVQLRAF